MKPAMRQITVPKFRRFCPAWAGYIVDLENNGLVGNASVDAIPMYVMTKAGIEMASRLREHTTGGGSYHDFKPNMGIVA